MKKKFNKKNIITIILGIIVSCIISFVLIFPLIYMWSINSKIDEKFNIYIYVGVIFLFYISFYLIFVKEKYINKYLFNIITGFLVSIICFIVTFYSNILFPTQECVVSIGESFDCSNVQMNSFMNWSGAITIIYLYSFISIILTCIYISFLGYRKSNIIKINLNEKKKK